MTKAYLLENEGFHEFKQGVTLYKQSVANIRIRCSFMIMKSMSTSIKIPIT